MTDVFRFDTESFPIRPSLRAPKTICLQYALDVDGMSPLNGEVEIVLRGLEMYKVLKNVLEDDSILLEALNGAFDFVSICAVFPELVPLVFRALARGRGRDVKLRQQLIQIKDGTMPAHAIKGYWSMAGLAKRLLNVVVDKSDETWRLRYALLDGVPPEQWPQDARDYAIGDITNLRAISRHQQSLGFMPEDEWLQVAADFVLELAGTWGLRVSGEKLEAAKKHFTESDVECVKVLESIGLMRGGSMVQAAVKTAVEDACAKAGVPVPKTEKGNTITDDDTCEMLKDFNPQLKLLSQHKTNTKMLSTYLEPMEQGVRFAMTSRPNALVNTGRTSWAGAKLKEFNPWWPEGTVNKEEIKVGTNLQNWPQDYGIRNCVIPREGFYFLSTDYNSLELRTLAQVCLWIVGHSTFAKGYQADRLWDPHSYFGGQLIGIDYEAALKRKATDKSFKKGPRAVGKEANFSLPGGVGGKRLYGSLKALFDTGQIDRLYTLDECYSIKEQWLDAYPEMREYFEYITWLVESKTPLKQFVSGRIRSNLTFPSAANSFFQGLAADLAKRALFYVSQACYCDPTSPLFGSRVVAFIHDELLLEVRIENSHDAAMEVERLMCKAFTEVAPDVPPAAESALMKNCWDKAAEPKWVDGKLVPFDLYV